MLVGLVSEMFVESVQGASLELGMTPAFVGFIVVAQVGAAAEMASAFSAARKNRLDLSVGIALFTAFQATNAGRSAWFVGVLLLMVYMVFAMTLYLLPPRAQ